METNRSHSIAFSGHRSFKAANEDISSLRMRLHERLSELIAEGYDTFLCGMAEGFDLLAAHEVLRLRKQHSGLRLVAALPHPGQADRFPRDVAQQWRDILDQADHIETVCPRYVSDCFHRRNDWMLDRAGTLVCFYNGSSGGTRYCVQRAMRHGLRIENLYCGENGAVPGLLF